MSIRAANLGLLVIAFSSLSLAHEPGSSSLEISFTSSVQIPEAVLKPGKYTFDLEDHLADRAIVKITEPGGAQHFLLTVPTDKLPKAKGLIYFKADSDTKILHGWECAACDKPLEFVYPKDEAVKLTATVGKPILAYDSSYDKLPDNLSAEDRKVVTLWLLAPKTVTAAGKGEGLTAAKYSKPVLSASNAAPLPKKMPKTASSVYARLIAGLGLLALGAAIPLRRKLIRA